MKKWFIRFGITLLSIFGLFFLCCFYLLNTESGLQFLVTQTENFLGDRLHIGKTKGKILDRLELSDITFKNTAGNTHIDHLVLDWKSAELLKSHLHIQEFSINAISYDAIPPVHQPEPVISEPFTLPELKLPITITIEDLAINNFTFLPAPGSETITGEEATVALVWDNSSIQIHKFNVTLHKIASFKAHGELQPTGDYPLSLTTSLKTLIPDFAALTVDGSYSGDLQQLHVQEEISGDIAVKMDMTLYNIISDFNWQGDIHILELNPAVFAPDIPGQISGHIETLGNLQQTAIKSTLAIRDKTASELNWDMHLDGKANLEKLQFNINQFTLKHAETTAAIELTGIADTEQNLDINLTWQNLKWPITNTPDYESLKGKASIKGNINAFHLALSTSVTGKEIPACEVHLNGDGNTKNIQNLLLNLSILDGEIALQGDVEWSPVIKWDIQSSAKQINPGIQYPDWAGKLDWQILSDGKLIEDGLSANISIDELEGQLRELPVTASGNIIMQPDDIRVEHLHLASGSAGLTVNGNLGEQSDLRWQIDIADFADLLPDASGQIEATGTVHKSMSQPQLNVKLSGTSLKYTDLALEKIESDIKIDTSWADPFAFNITAEELQSGKNRVKIIQLQGNGSREQHSILLDASHDMAAIKLAINGGYLEEQWNGSFNSFDILSTDFGDWNLQNPSKVSATPKNASLDALCLRRDNSDICMKGFWDSENINTKGDVQIQDVPLEWLAPWFPDTLDKLTGLFSAKAIFTMKDSLKADINAEITPGKITYQTDKKTDTLSHEGLQLTLKILDESLTADFNLSVNSNILSGTIKSPNLLEKDIGAKATLEGKLYVNAENFDLIEALTPEINALKGAIDLDLTIFGTIEQPDINGKGQLVIQHVLIPQIGLELADTSLDVLADNDSISLKGTFNSPEGSMQLTGTTSLNAKQGWDAHLALKGDNFRLIDLKDIKVFLSSDILFEKKDGIMSLTGEATIPKANILLRQLPPGTQSVSSDMIIIQQQKEDEVKSPFHMLLKISLGNNVHFVGFGFNAFIDGQLTVLSEPGEQMTGSGAFHIKQGSFRAYGQDLDIETGVISFPGGPISKPGINLRATRTIGDVVAGIYAIGPAEKPRLTTFSNPPMSEGHVISYLLTGSPPNDNGGTKLSIGKQINSKLSVSMGTDIKTGESEFVTRYRLNRKVHVQTTTGAESNAADIFYTIELEDDDLLDRQPETQKELQ